MGKNTCAAIWTCSNSKDVASEALKSAKLEKRIRGKSIAIPM